jgi:uncharacterized membrane protein YgaE (UPF0421/DUF939 family)
MMEDHALTHTDLIRALSDLHAKAEKHAQSLAYYNNEIHLLEQQLAEIQKPDEDWE